MVSKNEIVPKIGSIVADIIQQHDYLSQNLDDINELELELLMANATFLVDHIAILQRLTQKPNQGLVNKIVEQQTILVNEQDKLHASSNELSDQLLPVYTSDNFSKSAFTVSSKANLVNTESSSWKDSLVSDKETHFDFEKQDVKQLYDRPLTLAEKLIIDQKVDNFESPMEQAALDSTDIVDQSKVNLKLSINDLHRARNSVKTFDYDVVKDLKTMITTNDKLVFVKELFNGYSLAYNEAIQLVNQCRNFEEADHFLQTNYSKNNNWPTKQSYVDKFYKILKDRFSN